MIAHLHGTIKRLDPGTILVDVRGVGYIVDVPLDTYDELAEGSERSLWISTYVREDRLNLFGFLERGTRTLFELLIAQNGIGPKLGLEICGLPTDLLHHAIAKQDPAVLCTVKGVGKKKAEKLLLELKGLTESHPEILGTSLSSDTTGPALDQDAMEALSSLGYDTSTILKVLKELPPELVSTEERVTAALRAL